MLVCFSEKKFAALLASVWKVHVRSSKGKNSEKELYFTVHVSLYSGSAALGGLFRATTATMFNITTVA